MCVVACRGENGSLDFHSVMILLPHVVRPSKATCLRVQSRKRMQGIIMQTELKDKHGFSEEPPLPPAPNFNLASIEEAKPVEPLRQRRIPRFPRGGLRLGMAIFAGFTVMALGIATMARLDHQINVAPASAETSDTADAAEDSSADVATESAPAVSPNSSPSVVTERRRHRGHRYTRVPREMFGPEMFELEQPPVAGRPRARLVTVIQ
jgi:hypothetical protein